MFRNYEIGGKIIEKTAQIVKSGRISLSGGYEKMDCVFGRRIRTLENQTEAQRSGVRFGKEEQRNEREMTFNAKHKKSSQAIWSLLRRVIAKHYRCRHCRAPKSRMEAPRLLPISSRRSPAKRVRRENEEIPRPAQFSPQGGNGAVRGISEWSEWRDSNPRPLGPEPSAIPNFATPR